MTESGGQAHWRCVGERTVVAILVSTSLDQRWRTCHHRGGTCRSSVAETALPSALSSLRRGRTRRHHDDATLTAACSACPWRMLALSKVKRAFDLTEEERGLLNCVVDPGALYAYISSPYALTSSCCSDHHHDFRRRASSAGDN
jgi:hypothetical protein